MAAFQLVVVTDVQHVSHENKNVISTCVQVVFLCAGITHAVYYKTLKNALGIEAVSAPAFMDTIHSMHPIVKSMLDDVCETAKQEMKDKKNVAFLLTVLRH